MHDLRFLQPKILFYSFILKALCLRTHIKLGRFKMCSPTMMLMVVEYFNVRPLPCDPPHRPQQASWILWALQQAPCSGVVNTGFKCTDVSEAPKLRDDVPLGTTQCMSVMFSRWATNEFSSKQIAQEHSKKCPFFSHISQRFWPRKSGRDSGGSILTSASLSWGPLLSLLVPRLTCF